LLETEIQTATAAFSKSAGILCRFMAKSARIVDERNSPTEETLQTGVVFEPFSEVGDADRAREREGW
jgi:hypothetical protein